MVGVVGIRFLVIADNWSVDPSSAGIRMVVADHLLHMAFLEGADMVDESVYVGRACCGGIGLAFVGS